MINSHLKNEGVCKWGCAALGSMIDNNGKKKIDKANVQQMNS